MKRYLTFAILILTASLAGQVEHAPTVAQCEADQRLWMSKVEGPSSQLPGYYVVTGWASEMEDCEKVDPTNNVKYFNLEAEIIAEKSMRLSHFIDRQQLWDKFIAEDAAGKR